MAVINLGNDPEFVTNELDGIVIKKALADIPGGVFLNTANWPEKTIKAGHIIIRDTTTGEYMPLGVASGAYKTLTSNQEYVGVLRVTIMARKPAASVLIAGVVNKEAIPYPVTATIKAAIPNVQFI